MVKKILVVDDDTDILEIVDIILNSKGYQVVTHTTGLKVPEIVITYNPDLVLLDIQLPGKLGTDICSELKAISDHPPIVLFSANAKKEEAVKCKANGFIKKPFEMTNFLETIAYHVG